MNELLLISASFPTVIFTVGLFVSVIYWITAMLGFVDINALDMDLPEADGHLSLNAQSEPGMGESLAGLLMRLGLNGVPLTVVITFIALIGWALSSLLSRYSGTLFGYGWISYLTGVPIFAVSFWLAVMATARIIKPFRVLFSRLDQNVQKKILGQTVTIRTSRADNTFGEANMDDGGAGLILKVRARGESVFLQGDKAVLLEYDKATNTYTVISPEEFLSTNN